MMWQNAGFGRWTNAMERPSFERRAYIMTIEERDALNHSLVVPGPVRSQDSCYASWMRDSCTLSMVVLLTLLLSASAMG